MIKKVKYKIIIIVTTALLVVAAGLGVKWYSDSKNYTRITGDADKAISEERYDDAVALYKEAFKYKNNSSIDTKIRFVTVLKKSKEAYENAIKQMANKSYFEAIGNFKKVDKLDIKRYSNAQSKSGECTKLYIEDNLKNANSSLEASKFDDANKYIDNVLKLDANNTDAKKLKSDISIAIQNQKNTTTSAKINSYQNGKVSKDDALNIINSKIERDDKSNSAIIKFYISDSNKTINGEEYYEARMLFQNPNSPMKGWHPVVENNGTLTRYININNGKVYKISNNNLILSEENIKM